MSELNPLEYWHKVRAKKTAAIELLSGEIVQIDATIRLLDIKASKIEYSHMTPKEPYHSPVSPAWNKVATTGTWFDKPDKNSLKKKGYKRKNSWEGLDEDLKVLFNDDASAVFTVDDVYNVIRTKPYYKDISRASIGSYLVGLRRAGFLEYEQHGRAYMYCKKKGD